jgi:hypothetical protein
VELMKSASRDGHSRADIAVRPLRTVHRQRLTGERVAGEPA